MQIEGYNSLNPIKNIFTEHINENVKAKSGPPRNEVWRMFDRIAVRYDLLNRLLSFGQDVVWRNNVVRHLGNTHNQRVLDVATGTGDLLLALLKKSAVIHTAVGVDMAGKMLALGREKIMKRGLDNVITFVRGDAEVLPIRSNVFDAVTIAFGIRNVTHVHTVLKDMYRVLKNKGRIIILEFSLPVNRFIKTVYLVYFRRVLPIIGSLISGDRFAYRYLNLTVESFPYGSSFCELLESAGFQNVYECPLTFGIATIYCGEKP